MPSRTGLCSTLISLWLRLTNLAILSLLFAEAVVLAQGKAQGWSYFLPLPEVGFEAVVRLIAAALAGILLGTACTILVAPFLAFFPSSREQFVSWITRMAAVLLAFLVFRFALGILITSVHALAIHGDRFKAVLFGAYYLAFATVLLIPRARTKVVANLDGFASEKMSRRAAVATVVGTAALVTTEYVLSQKISKLKAPARVRKRSASNLLLITFDALSAEDVSVYGYRLATTPNIDAFAQKATVFTNFYSGSTFTSPCIATMLTGLFPSETRIYQMEGRIRGPNTLPHVMGDAGFSTGAFLSNSNAYYLAQSLENAYDLLPEPVYQEGALRYLWEATTPLHQDTRIGNRLDEYIDLMKAWNSVARNPESLYVRYRAASSFDHARQMLDKLPEGFFLWVHVMTPHSPYLPDPSDQGRFLTAEQLRNFDPEGPAHWRPHYEPDQQNQVEGRRLLYDEFILTADRAFGTFMADLEEAGKLRNTTVILSADHGESFEGGVYQHQSPYLTRPVIHIPLIIRTLSQQNGGTVSVSADQTSLAPTILELAGQPIPKWMRGPSLVSWLNRDGQGNGEGLAFSQYLERNSAFKPIHQGSVGVIDGEYQYVVYLGTQKGALRPLNQAQIWNLDCSAEHPERAKALRTAIDSRFPDVVQAT
jgi:arylsulfatase A-like enzyme